MDERKLVVASPRQRLLLIESRPTSRCVEIELRHSEAEFQLWIDLASRLLERVRKVVFKRDRRQCELDQVRIGLDARLPLGLPMPDSPGRRSGRFSRSGGRIALPPA
jgi:hypothetical protein